MAVRLTNENFFDNIREVFPEQLDDFLAWLGEYVEAEKWHLLFREGMTYYDMPFEFQYVILLKYFRDEKEADWPGIPEGDLYIRQLLHDCFLTQKINDDSDDTEKQINGE